MRAVILTGGKGKRLAPYTTSFPKALMPVGDIPILEIVVRQLKYYGVKHVTFAVGHFAGLVEAFFGDGSKFSLKIVYSLEDVPLGTAGPISIIEDLNEPFIIMNADLLTTINFKKLMQYHRDKGRIGTICTTDKKINIQLGVLEISSEGLVSGYTEKPTLQYTVSTGIYIFEPRIKDYLEKGEHLDFPNLINHLVSVNEKIACYKLEGGWYDIGTPSEYSQAIIEFEKRE